MVNQSSDENDGAGRKVVVAEDEALIRLDIVESLRSAGYNVVGEAANGQEAIDLARKTDPDVVILDVKDAGMDSITAAKTITSEGIAPVVMLTAFRGESLVRRASDAGAMAYVVKPFVPEKLFPAIEIAISLRPDEHPGRGLRPQGALRRPQEVDARPAHGEHGLTESEAFRWIQKTSMDRRLTMAEVADAVISQVDED